MIPDQLETKLLTVSGLFDDDAIYTVPVYQRNYAWKTEQIEQLIKDIQDAQSPKEEQGYFLGNLVTQRGQGKSKNDFEVVDGQQRLTTLYLLLTFLEKNGESPYTHHRGRLRYESRPRASEALHRAGQQVSEQPDSSTSEDSGIHQGFNSIQQTLEQHEKLKDEGERNKFADFLRTKVTVVRASLPPKTDLNRYFEIMNTRGQQLNQVDIVKARLMSKLPDPKDRADFARIWDACADMDSYVQMSLTRGNTELRSNIFGTDWSWLARTDFASVSSVLREFPQAEANTSTSGAFSLEKALSNYAKTPQQHSGEDEGRERFRSPIGFPVFLLHVLKVKKGNEEENEEQLDDKQLISSFDKATKATEKAEQWVQEFAFTLLKCRNLFDSFILKRQFVTSTEDEDGDWSLQRLIKRVSKGRSTPGYVHVFSKTVEDNEQEGKADDDTRDVLLLQSMLRITYTSPRTMHWITMVLRWLTDIQDPRKISSSDLAERLRKYAREKVRVAFFDPTQPEPESFSIRRIVFTYLDYLILEEDQTAKRNFKFQFRNSIEHFYPQNPEKEQSGATVSDENLHLLGNLALVSVGMNSQFSNSLPKAKAENFKDKIESQSPKLQLMAKNSRDGEWDDAQVKKHHVEMVELLEQDIKKGASIAL